MKKYLGIIIFFLVSLAATGKSFADTKINLYFFWGQGCPHCAQEELFLQNLVKNDKDLVLHDFEVYNSVEGRDKLQEAARILKTEVNGVPFLVIGEKYIVGYLSDETTGKEIEKIIKEYKETGYYDIFSTENTKPSPTLPEKTTKPALPKIGNLNLEKLSLPALTVVLGFLDGFNPCAMWVLLFLISLLLGMRDKKRMWILGATFIIASASVYFLFMVAWLNLFIFVGYIFWVRVLIALVSVIGGVISLRKFWSKDNSGCDIAGEEKRKTVFEKLGSFTSNSSFFIALVGIAGLAFAVNLIELVCSAGLPAVYTQILALNNLNMINYYLYILLYILFFMLDDLFVFFVAMITLQMTGVTTKYVKWSRLIGGIMMIAIGFLLVFRPEILMFG